MTRVVEAIIEPQWYTATMDLDGATHVVLHIDHPRHGGLDFVLSKEEAQGVAGALIAEVTRAGAVKMAALVNAPPTPAEPLLRVLDSLICGKCGGAGRYLDEAGDSDYCPRCHGNGYLPLASPSPSV